MSEFIICTFSSVGQSYRLITGWSGVRVPEGAPKRAVIPLGITALLFLQKLWMCHYTPLSSATAALGLTLLLKKDFFRLAVSNIKPDIVDQTFRDSGCTLLKVVARSYRPTVPFILFYAFRYGGSFPIAEILISCSDISKKKWVYKHAIATIGRSKHANAFAHGSVCCSLFADYLQVGFLNNVRIPEICIVRKLFERYNWN